MTPQQIYQMLTSVSPDVPWAYYRFLDTPENPAPAPPFGCFFYPNSNDFYADSENFQHIASLAVELYTDAKDFTLEASFEDAFASHGLAWDKEETYIDSERMHMTTWTMDAVLTAPEPAPTPTTNEGGLNHA